MANNWLMMPSEAARWSDRLANGMDSQVWESIAFSGFWIGLWLVLLILTVVGFIPFLKKGILKRMSPSLSVFTFLGASFVATLTHSAVFSAGVIAYWVNQSLPTSQMEVISKWTFTYLTFFGWAFS